MYFPREAHGNVSRRHAEKCLAALLRAIRHSSSICFFCGLVACRKALLLYYFRTRPGCLRFAHARSLCASSAADRVRSTAKISFLLCSCFAPRTTLPPVAKALRPWNQTGGAPAPSAAFAALSSVRFCCIIRTCKCSGFTLFILRPENLHFINSMTCSGAVWRIPPGSSKIRYFPTR